MRHTATVLPSWAATCSIARITLRLAAASVSKLSNSLSASEASTVPAQVRKSLAVKASPAIILQIGVDVRRIDRLPLAFLVDVLEQLLAGDLLAGAHDAGEAAIAQRRAVQPAALAAVFEDDLGAREVDVAVAHGGKPVAAIVAGIFLIADPDERDLEEAHDGRQDLLARQPAARLIFGHARTKPRQCPGKRQHAVELGGVAERAPVGVVAILLAALRIAPGRLQVALAVGADPDVGPGRRDGQPLEAGDLPAVLDRAALGVAIAEGAARAPTPDARHVVGDVA